MSRALLLRSFFGCISFVVVCAFCFNLLKPFRRERREIPIAASGLSDRHHFLVQGDTMNSVAAGGIEDFLTYELRTLGTINQSIVRLSWKKVAETSPRYTEVKILTNEAVQNRRLRMVIHARDVNNRPQVTGGDLIYPVITDKKRGYYQTGAVHDFDNGSYLIEFEPNWAGSASFQITLAYPSKFRRATVRGETYGYIFICFYAKNLKSSALANVKPFQPSRHTASVMAGKPFGHCYFNWKPMAYRQGEKWCAMNAPAYSNYVSCERPGGGVKCEDTFSCVYESRMLSVAQAEYRRHKPALFMNLLNVPSITIQPDDAAKSSIPCTEFFSGRNVTRKVIGSWMSANEFVPKCSHPCKTTDDLMRCVTDSHWYFLGDSTVRQLVEQFNCIIGVESQCHASKEVHIERTFFPKCRCTTELRFFGLPLASSGSFRNLTAQAVPYGPDTIDLIEESNAPGGDVLVLGSTHHHVYIPLPGFVKRTIAIRDALIRLRRRAPRIKIIWKGTNPRETLSCFFRNNAKIEFYESIAREIMKDVPSIFIIDAWNMFLGSPFRLFVHYPGNAVRELLRLLVGIACSK